MSLLVPALGNLDGFEVSLAGHVARALLYSPIIATVVKAVARSAIKIL